MPVKNILIVEDSEPDQFLNKAILNRGQPKMNIMQAYDGVEALEFLEETHDRPDLILLDINMPRMNGHEFLKAYTERFNAVPPVVIMLTSSDQERDKQDALQYPCVVDYLLKPLNFDHVEKFSKLAA